MRTASPKAIVVLVAMGQVCLFYYTCEQQTTFIQEKHVSGDREAA